MKKLRKRLTLREIQFRPRPADFESVLYDPENSPLNDPEESEDALWRDAENVQEAMFEEMMESHPDDLVDGHYVAIRNQVLSWLKGDESVADDVTQEVFASYLERIDQIELAIWPPEQPELTVREWMEGPDPFPLKLKVRNVGGFLKATAWNQLMDVHRRNKKAPQLPEQGKREDSGKKPDQIEVEVADGVSASESWNPAFVQPLSDVERKLVFSDCYAEARQSLPSVQRQAWDARLKALLTGESTSTNGRDLSPDASKARKKLAKALEGLRLPGPPPRPFPESDVPPGTRHGVITIRTLHPCGDRLYVSESLPTPSKPERDSANPPEVPHGAQRPAWDQSRALRQIGFPSGQCRSCSSFDVWRSYSPKKTVWTFWCYKCGKTDVDCREGCEDELGKERRFLTKSDKEATR